MLLLFCTEFTAISLFYIVACVCIRKQRFPPYINYSINLVICVFDFFQACGFYCERHTDSGLVLSKPVLFRLSWIIRWSFMHCAHNQIELIPEQPGIGFQHRGQLRALPLPPPGRRASIHQCFLFFSCSLSDPSPFIFALMINPSYVLQAGRVERLGNHADN